MLYFDYVLRESPKLVLHKIQCLDNLQRVPLWLLCNDYLMLMPAFSHYIERYLDAMPGEMKCSSPSDEAFLEEKGEETNSNSTHTGESRGASTSKYCRARSGGGNGRVAYSAVRKLEVGTS